MTTKKKSGSVITETYCIVLDNHVIKSNITLPQAMAFVQKRKPLQLEYSIMREVLKINAKE